MSKSFRGLCTLPLEFFYKTLRQPTLVFDTSEIYRKESFDLSISQCSFPVIPTSDHMILYIMFFLPQWRALNKRCTAVHSPALQSSVWPLLLSELWPSLSLPVGEGYKLLFYLLFRHYVKKKKLLQFHKIWSPVTHFSLWKGLFSWQSFCSLKEFLFTFINWERTDGKFIRNWPFDFYRKITALFWMNWTFSFSACLSAYILLSMLIKIILCLFSCSTSHNYLCNFQLLIFGLKSLLESFPSMFELFNNFPVLLN